MPDHHRMIVNLNESQIRALDQVRAVLDGTQTLDFAPAASPAERHEGLRWCCAACAITSSGSLIVGSPCAIFGALVASAGLT
jgi:hypothetical protein